MARMESELRKARETGADTIAKLETALGEVAATSEALGKVDKRAAMAMDEASRAKAAEEVARNEAESARKDMLDAEKRANAAEQAAAEAAAPPVEEKKAATKKTAAKRGRKTAKKLIVIASQIFSVFMKLMFVEEKINILKSGFQTVDYLLIVFHSFPGNKLKTPGLDSGALQAVTR